MKLLIEIPEEAKQAFDCAESNDIKGSFYDHGGVIGNAIKNGTPIPDNATNGDVIKAMFPSDKGELKDTSDTVLAYILDDLYMLYLSDYWWKKPYKEEHNANDS